MGRTVSLRLATGVAGVVLGLTGSLVGGVLLAAPGSASTGAGDAARAAGGAGNAAAAATSTATGSATSTATPTGTPSTGGGSPTATTSSPICPTYTSPPAWPNGVGPSWTFEDGTARTWYALSGSGVSLGVTTEAAASGTRSLRVDGLTATGAARVTPTAVPSITWYKVTARVRAVAGSSPAYVTMSATSTSAADRRPMTRRVTSDGWTDLVTYFRPDQKYPPGTCSGLGWVPASTDVTFTAAAGVCPDAPAGPVSVYVDDVAVTVYAPSGEVATPPTSTDQLPNCGTTSPPTTPPAQCTASYQVASQWSGGHQAALTVRNQTATTLHPWSVQVVFPDDAQIYALWGAGTWTWNQAGRTVVVNEPSWGQPLPPGGSVTIGLVRAGAPRPPTSVTLNGMACVLAV